MSTSSPITDDLRRVIERHWGFRAFRPLQEQAMAAALAGRDSLVVMPTGGGKSLCYQAPAVARGGTTVVVSPLISLMKDQVDGLQACGVPATQIDSSLTPAERSARETDVVEGALRLLFVAPERLALDGFCNLLRRVDVKSFAIDEAHCISHWGHDFRPDYRQLGKLKTMFPAASIHAFTATATQKVREDICKQLGLTNPLVLVGNFDRPNLTYRVFPKKDLYRQIEEVLTRHKKEAGIIYCLRRKDVDEITGTLNERGYHCKPYHAGMTPDQRRSAQEAFAQEQCDLIVATVAFGMGIDRSNIRYVLHTSLPKSIEHFQQETGRAGRDGLEAECVLLWGFEDLETWRFLIEKTATEAAGDGTLAPTFLASALQHLEDMKRYATGAMCRHRSLVQYFGQKYDKANCGGCDICLGDNEPVPDAVVIAQKILSCVYRVQERFGVNHVISVLRGENTDKIRSMGHDKLSTYGLLKEHSKVEIRDWIHQLIGQNVLLQEGDEYPILKLNEASFQVMKKELSIRLLRPAGWEEGPAAPRGKSKADETSWEGVDRELFEELRLLRRDLATQRSVPPYVIFSDATLRELAHYRPSSLKSMNNIRGIGERKLQDFGEAVLKIIDLHCTEHGLSRDVGITPRRPERPPEPPESRITGAKARAFELFRQGAAVEDVMHQINRSLTSVMDYLAQYIRREKISDISRWLKPDIHQRINMAIKEVGAVDRLKPLFEMLGGTVAYEDIRLAVAHYLACG